MHSSQKKCICTLLASPCISLWWRAATALHNPSFNMHMYHSSSYYSSVAPTATAREIRTKLARALHPDKNRPRQSCRLSMRSGQC